jgi:ATP-binding cassette subfamily F protein 3
VLSGGEKIRLLFARIFANPPNLLMLDEPTTHLDIKARETLQDTIKSYHGTVIFVSHDIEFVKKTADIIVFIEQQNLKKYFGGYDYYLEKSANDKFATVSASSKIEKETDEKKTLRKQRAEQRQKLYPVRKELTDKVRQSEKKLNTLCIEKKELMDKIVTNEPGLDYASINKRLKEIDTKIRSVTVEWEKFSLELETIDI